MQGKDITDKTRAYAGVDVCKEWLDVCVLGGGREETWRVSNDARGIDALRRRLLGRPPLRVAIEATGRMHLAAWRALAEAGLTVVVLNPFRARRFAEALGRFAKTDAIDARVLALAAERLEAAPAEPPSPARARLRELVALRRGLVADKVAAANRLSGASDPFVRRTLLAAKRSVERRLRRVEAEIEAAIAADPTLARQRAILVSMPGVGPVAAAVLLADLPELGRASDKEIAALVGVAPMNRDSGASTGQRHIRGGRATLRATLSLPAPAASRANPDLKSFRARLRGQHKPHRVVITAVIRKLVILANALIRDDRLWTPAPP